MLRNVRTLVAYDGTRFFGWQRQDGFRSVQEALEEAVLGATGERVTVRGSGRTDTGVHAFGQVASFHVDTRLDDERLLHALNAHLDEGATLRALHTCPDDFHAQRSATGKRYLYLVETARFRSPFSAGRAHFERRPLDHGAMARAARHFVGRHDFTSLASAGSPRATNVRTITGLRLVLRRRGFGLVVGGNGFLYNMVRTLTGTLLQVGLGRRDPDSIPGLLEARDRGLAGPTAPPEGLYLVSVRYPEPPAWQLDRVPQREP